MRVMERAHAQQFLGEGASEDQAPCKSTEEGAGCESCQEKPLVSVLVRSMNRQHLRLALESLALQTYPKIEVLVIGAVGSEHSALDISCGSLPLRLVSTSISLGRSKAANIGLEHAAGEYLLLLDDDDWLAPTHVSSLVASIERNCGCRAAYAGVELRDVHGELLKVAPFNAGYGAGRLRSGNSIPLHAVLFARTLVSQGARFDEALEVYEDWDFLLQLSQRTPFAYVGTVSAYHRAGGTSGVGVLADENLQRRSRERLVDKWKHIWTGSQVEEMLRAMGEIEREKLVQARDALHRANAALGRTEAMLAERELQLEHLARKCRRLSERLEESYLEIEACKAFECGLVRSWSWRLSAPVRWAGLGVRRAGMKVKRALRHNLGKLLGHSLWLDEEPIVTQGFSGEPIGESVDSGERPLISVIMPVYNACRSDPRFLLRALESVAGQTYPNIELIIVDDGSTDDSRRVCMDFLAAHPDLRAQHLSEKNGGQSRARNLGVKASRGEYVSFLDQDDEWFEDKLERVVPWLANKDIDMLYTDADCIDADGKIMFRAIHRTQRCGWPHPKRTVEDILFKDVFVMPGVMTIKRQAFEQIGGFDESLSGYEDDDLFLRLFDVCRIFYLPVPTLRWRMYGDNYSSSHRMLSSRISYWKKLLENFTDEGANQFRADRISLRFFTQFLSQALLQHRAGNALCWKNLEGAREILPYLPQLPRLLYSFVFRFPDRIVLSLLQWTRKLIPN